MQLSVKHWLMAAMAGCHAWIVFVAGSAVRVDWISGGGCWISGDGKMFLKIFLPDLDDPHIDELSFLPAVTILRGILAVAVDGDTVRSPSQKQLKVGIEIYQFVNVFSGTEYCQFPAIYVDR